MTKYRKKPVEIDATQWWANGDHPEDNPTRDGTTPNGQWWEGFVVGYYRDPYDLGERACEACGCTMHEHGWIDTAEGGHVVCPGDFVITGVKGERYPCKPDVFHQTYDRVDGEA